MAIYFFGPFRLDSEKRTLSLGTSDLAVGSKLVDTLLALAEHPGRVRTTQQLLDQIWPEGYADAAGLRQNIYVLRKLMGGHWAAPVIESIPRTGYRFVAPLQAVEPYEAISSFKIATPTPKPLLRWLALAACVVLAIATLRSAAGPARGAAAALNAQDARLYALGRFYWSTRTKDGVLKSVKYFQQIVRAEPDNALGYSGLADAYYIESDYGYGRRSEKTYLEWQRRNAEKAYALNPNLSEVRVSRAQMLERVYKDVKSAQAEYVRALELNPNNAVAHHWYGVMLYHEGEIAAAHNELEAAEQLDPTAPAISRWLAMDEYLNRRYDRAIAYYRQTLDLNPKDSDAATMLGLAYEGLHDYAAALRSFRRAEKVCSCLVPLALEARTLALMGLPQQASAKLSLAQRPSKGEKVEPLDIAAALVAMGQRDRALDWLRRSISDHFAAVWLRLDPRLDAMRGDPRFGALLAKTQAACSLSC